VSNGITVVEVMTLPELARYLGVSKSTVYRSVHLSQVPAFRVGRQWRVNLNSVQNHLVDSYERKTGLRGSCR
jgi:excisionase family DNA binding protein